MSEVVRYAYRSFDRQWIIKDARLGDFMRPVLWQAHGDHQVYMTSLLTKVLGLGPAATVTGEVPDRDYFSGRGGKDVIPLWRDSSATEPNIAHRVLGLLTEAYGAPITPEDLFAYAYAVLASPSYVESFSEELIVPGPRLPVTRDPELFWRAVRFGRELIRLHTFGERFSTEEEKETVPQGQARNTKGIPDTPEGYPESFSYDGETKTLHVGEGEFRPVEPKVMEFSVSGLEVVHSWLSYRKKEPTGRSPSPLDKVRPKRWTGPMTDELLALLWVLEATIERETELENLLTEIVESELFTADEFPDPTDEERQPPRAEYDAGHGMNQLNL